MIYSKIFDFCAVRNKGSYHKNVDGVPRRVIFLINLLKELNLSYEIDKFPDPKNSQIPLFNILLKGQGKHWFVAHHDIYNPESENANDNSCSVINLIALKLLRPEINVCLTDAEEFGGLGAQRLSDQILSGKIEADWILNLELTGIGGKNFFIGNYPGVLSDKIIKLFDPPIMFRLPFNDAVIFQRNGIDTCVINPLPLLGRGTSDLQTKTGEYLDLRILYRCHQLSDSCDKISIDDMKEFVEEVLVPIAK
jgi:hypothetical protein